MDVFDLFAKLSLDTSEYDEGLKDAEKSGSSFGDKLATAGKVGMASLAALGTATVATGTALVNGTSEVASYGDNIDKMSQKIGISAQAYQEWDAVMQHCGASVDSLQPAMKTLATQAQSGNEAFQQLGISEEEVANLSQEDLFAKVVSGLQGMEEGTERTYIASQLLGRGATELGALFNTSAEDTQAMIDTVHELGGVMSDDAVKSAAAFQDQLQDMQTSFSGLKRNMLGNFMPALTTVMGGLTAIFAGDYDEGLDQISAGIDEFVTNLTEIMPTILEVGVSIIEALATSIIENLPTLLPTIIDLVIEIANMLIENLPLLLEAAMQIILQLAMGIIDALPDLIPAIVEVILTIVDYLTQPATIEQLITAAIQLIGAIAIGLVKAIPVIVARVPQIIMNIIQALTGLSPDMVKAGWDMLKSFLGGIIDNIVEAFETGVEIFNNVKNAITEKIEGAKQWGKDLIDNFVQGIKDKIQKVKDEVGAVAQTVKDILGFSEPEEGPLSNFHTYAPDMMNLFAQGIRDNEKMLTDTVADAFDFQDVIANADIVANADSTLSVSQAGGGFNYDDIVSIITDAFSNILVQVNIGDTNLDDIISTSISRTAYRSGGR